MHNRDEGFFQTFSNRFREICGRRRIEAGVFVSTGFEGFVGMAVFSYLAGKFMAEETSGEIRPRAVGRVFRSRTECLTEERIRAVPFHVRAPSISFEIAPPTPPTFIEPIIFSPFPRPLLCSLSPKQRERYNFSPPVSFFSPFPTSRFEVRANH